MPRSLHKNATFKVELENDKEIPQESRPWFEFRYLSAAKMIELVAKAEQIDVSEKGSEGLRILFEVINSGLVGWGNMVDPQTDDPIPFEPERLGQLLTLNEAFELHEKMKNQGVDQDTLKN